MGRLVVGGAVMGTALLPRHPHYLRRPPGVNKYTLPIPKFPNFRNDAVRAMRDLPFSRLSAHRLFASRFRDPKAFCIRIPDLMADHSSKNPEQEAVENSHSKGENQAEKLPPPLPEKPLPGDCCGSGCVRCVWDVYYEELEAYNEYYKNQSDPKS